MPLRASPPSRPPLAPPTVRPRTGAAGPSLLSRTTSWLPAPFAWTTASASGGAVSVAPSTTARPPPMTTRARVEPPHSVTPAAPSPSPDPGPGRRAREEPAPVEYAPMPTCGQAVDGQCSWMDSSTLRLGFVLNDLEPRVVLVRAPGG
jgi:hypothetical protein